MTYILCFILAFVTFGAAVLLGVSKLEGRTKFVFIVSGAIAFLGSSYALFSQAHEYKVDTKQEQIKEKIKKLEAEKPKTKERAEKTHEQALHDVWERYASFIDHLCRDYPDFCKADRNARVEGYDVVYKALLAPYCVDDTQCGFKILIDYDDSSTVIRLKWIAYAQANVFVDVPLHDYLLLLDFILNAAFSNLGG